MEALRQTQNTLFFVLMKETERPKKKQTVTNKVIFFVCAPIALIYRIGNIADTNTYTHKKRAQSSFWIMLAKDGVWERLMIHH